jgi:hypothetical protein
VFIRLAGVARLCAVVMTAWSMRPERGGISEGPPLARSVSINNAMIVAGSTAGTG